MTELERALVELGGRLDFPEAPDLVPAVRARLVERPRRIRRPSRRLLVIALAALAVAIGAAFAVPPARTAILEWLGLRGVRIERVSELPVLPEPPPLPSGQEPPAAPPTLGSDLGLGALLTLDEARRRVGYRILVPTLANLGEPDAVYVDDARLALAGAKVMLVWGPRPGLPVAAGTDLGLLITQFEGRTEPAFFKKVAGPETVIEEVEVNGGRGVWLEGEPHAVFYTDASGDVVEEVVRLAGNVLLWERGELTFRLESALSKREALRIARSVS